MNLRVGFSTSSHSSGVSSDTPSDAGMSLVANSSRAKLNTNPIEIETSFRYDSFAPTLYLLFSFFIWVVCSLLGLPYELLCLLELSCLLLVSLEAARIRSFSDHFLSTWSHRYLLPVQSALHGVLLR